MAILQRLKKARVGRKRVMIVWGKMDGMVVVRQHTDQGPVIGEAKP